MIRWWNRPSRFYRVKCDANWCHVEWSLIERLAASRPVPGLHGLLSFTGQTVANISFQFKTLAVQTNARAGRVFKSCLHLRTQLHSVNSSCLNSNKRRTLPRGPSSVSAFEWKHLPNNEMLQQRDRGKVIFTPACLFSLGTSQVARFSMFSSLCTQTVWAPWA